MADAEKPVVLLVDDSDANRYLLRRYLERADFNVWDASSGSDAVEQALRRPNLVVMDINLPDANGYELCRQLKLDSRTCSIPVMLISSVLKSSSDKVRGLDAGADGYLVSPVNPEELIAHVNLLLRLRASQAALSQANERLQEVLSSITDIYFSLDEQWRILELNAAAERSFFRRSASEVIGKVLWEEYPEAESSELAKQYHHAVRAGQAVHFEAKSVISQRWYESHVYPRERCLEVYLRDITDRKDAELRTSVVQQRLQAILDNTQAVIYIIDAAGRYLLVNRRFEELFQCDSGSITGKTLWETFPREIADKFAANNQRVLEAGKAVEFEELAPHGHAVHTYLSVKVPLLEPSGRAYAICGISTDITRRKAAEDALRQLNLELEQAQAELREHAQQLERKVQERTAKLTEANAQLRVEIAERKTVEESRAALLRKLITVEEEERRRIARELHDEMGQHVTALSLGLKALKDAAPGWAEAARMVPALESMTDRIGQEVHRLAVELRPTALDDLGLLVTLRNYVQSWGLRTKTEVDFQNVNCDGEDIPPEIESTFYRVVQEGLNNIAKHARASRASVVLEHTENQLQVILEDNGCGFDPDTVLHLLNRENKLGIRGMRERLEMLGGSLHIESSLGSGTTIFARVPISSSNETNANDPDSAG